LSLIKRHRVGLPHFGAFLKLLLYFHTCQLFPGIIAAVEENTCPRDDLTVCVGDFVSPMQLAAQQHQPSLVQQVGGPAFGLRPRFWMLKSLTQSSVAPVPDPKCRPASLLTFSTLCCFAAASLLIWAKYRESEKR
jgi:hypothetical protein